MYWNSMFVEPRFWTSSTVMRKQRNFSAMPLLRHMSLGECNRSKYLKLAGFRFPFHELTIHNPMNVRFTHEVVDLTWNTVLPKDEWDFCSVEDSHNVSRFYPGGTN